MWSERFNLKGGDAMNEGRMFECFKITDTELLLVMQFGLLAEMVDDPDPDPRRGRTTKRTQEPSLLDEHRQAFTAARDAVQRAFKGTKKSNVASYKRHLVDLFEGRQQTGAPCIELWAGEAALDVQQIDRHTFVSIPRGLIMVAVDGETQLAARLDLLQSAHPQGVNAIVKVIVHHNIKSEAAQQIFHYRNARGVAVSASLAMTRDYSNDITIAARSLVPILGDDLATLTDQRGKVSLMMIRRALLWHLFGKLNEPVRRTMFVDVEAGYNHLAERLSELRPFLAEDARLRTPAMFIACTDVRVSLRDIAARERDDPQWTSTKYTTAGILLLVNHIRPRLPFASETSAVAVQ
jgi:hypothetical protein